MTAGELARYLNTYIGTQPDLEDMPVRLGAVRLQPVHLSFVSSESTITWGPDDGHITGVHFSGDGQSIELDARS